MTAPRRWPALLAFAIALVVVVFAPGRGASSVTQAIIWLPTGVAIAGVWLLGPRALWIVAAATLVHRLSADYSPPLIVPAVIGSTCEALLGVVLLRRLGLRGDFARLRDTLALFAAAALAPLASLGCSWLGRHLTGQWPDLGDPMGFVGWWRMNALGALTVVPMATTWASRVREPAWRRAAVEAGLLVAATAALLWAVMPLLPAEPTSIMLLYVILPVALAAALRLGQCGAATTAAAGAWCVATIATLGHGPFLCVPVDERHVAIQIFLLTLLGVPLVIGSLIAEREASMTRWLQSEGVRDALLRVLPDATYRLGADGTMLDVFAPEGVTLPFARESMVGRRITEVASPGLAERFQAAIATTLRGTRPDPLEYRLDLDGGPREREARFVRLADAEVLCVVRDITERKRAQRLMRWQADTLELVATGRTNAEVFPALVRGIESFLDQGLGSLLLLEGQTLHVACAPGLPAAWNALVEGLPIGPERGSCGAAAHENRTVIAADIAGDPRWRCYADRALAHGLRACWSVPVRSPAGAVCGTFAIYHRTVRAPSAAEIDLVERAATLAGIAIDRERREHLLASIHRNVGEGIYRSVPGQGLVYVNRSFARLFGYESPEALLATLANGSVAPPEHAADLARFVASRPAPTAEVRLHRRDGSTFWALLSCSSMHGPDGAVSALDGSLADITAQKRLEDQLRQSQKMEAVGKLAGGVAHDFNNLLTVIAGYAEAVREKLPPGSESGADVDEVLRAAERASSLTRQLLAFSRQQVLSPLVVDLVGVVDEHGAMLRRLIGEPIRLVVEHAPGPVHVRVDRGQIEQVLLNLAVNARDAMPDGGTLTISTAPVAVDESLAAAHVDLAPGPYVALIVRDTGVGMTSEVRARAFDPFFTTKEVGKGTGLGLSTVYGIVKQSGGAVWIDSTPGAGTTVWIWLPRVTDAPAAERPAPSARPNARRATVLVAEDEPLVRDLVQRILSRAGYDVLIAGDGPAALELVQQRARPIDLLLTDAVMPQMSGRTLASRLSALQPGLPVLFMSGYASDSQHLVSAVGGPTDFLQKPFVASRLVERVAALLDRALAGALPRGSAAAPAPAEADHAE